MNREPARASNAVGRITLNAILSNDPNGRYSVNALLGLNLCMNIEVVGTRPQVLVAEKIQLINYAIIQGQLPPGNRIFK
jgi:hypothetical protein